jgi:hypothetical protein
MRQRFQPGLLRGLGSEVLAAASDKPAGRAVLQDSARDTSGLFLVQRLAFEGGVADGTERNRVAWIR